MHAIVSHVNLKPGRGDEAMKLLKEEVLPRAKEVGEPVAGYWARSVDGSQGVSIVLYASKEAADEALATMMAQGTPPPDAPVELGDAGVYEVLASA